MNTDIASTKGNLEEQRTKLICSQEAFKVDGHTNIYVLDIVSTMVKIADVDRNLALSGFKWMLHKRWVLYANLMITKFNADHSVSGKELLEPLTSIACIKSEIEEGADSALLYNSMAALIRILEVDPDFVTGMVDQLIELIDHEIEANSSTVCQGQVEDQDKPCTISVELNTEEATLLHSTMHESSYKLMCKHGHLNTALNEFVEYRNHYLNSYPETPQEEDPEGFSEFQIREIDIFSNMLKDLSYLNHEVFEYMIDFMIDYISTESTKLYRVITCRNSMEKG